VKIALLKTPAEITEALKDFPCTYFPLDKQSPESLVDYDVFLADVKEYSSSVEFSILSHVARDILQKVWAGGILIMFAAKLTISSQYNWLTFFDKIRITNSTSSSLYSPKTGIQKIFNSLTPALYSECYFSLDKEFEQEISTLFLDGASRVVGFWWRLNQGVFILLPRCSKTGFFVRKVLTEFIPHLIGGFDIFSEVHERLPWEDRIESCLPGIDKLNQQIDQEQDNKMLIEEQIKKLESKKKDLTQWVDLIRSTGKRLETIVIRAFDLLGLKPKYKPVGDFGPDVLLECDTNKFIVEVEGSDNCIDLDKGRQLLDWVASLETEHDIIGKGILVGNPYRKQSLENRPPSQNQKNFTLPLIDFARRHNLGLLWTKDLFELVKLKLAGKTIPIDEIIQSLASANGMVDFNFEGLASKPSDTN
jgi:hypothetical protein